MRRQRIPWFGCSVLLSTCSTFASSAVTPTSSGSFPGRLPDRSTSATPTTATNPAAPKTWWTDSGGSSDSDHDELSSSSDVEEERVQPNIVAASSLSEIPTSGNSSPRPSTVENTKFPQQSSKEQPSSPKPLQTLQKLQQMLDETDYVTSRRPPNTEHELWTSKDRSKYKKVQMKMRQQQSLSPPIHHSSDDDEEAEETDDGLGYTLANVPVYFSDAESDEEAEAQQQPLSNIDNASPQPVYPAAPQIPHTNPTYNHQQQYQQYPGPQSWSPQSGHEMPPPPPQYPHQYHTPDPYAQQQQPYGVPPDQQPLYPPYGSYPYPYHPTYPPQVQHQMPEQQQQPRPQEVQSSREWHTPKAAASVKPHSSNKQKALPANSLYSSALTPSLGSDRYAARIPVLASQTISNLAGTQQKPESLVEASSKINFDSIQKISLLLATMALMCYSAVSPRNLPLPQYNAGFYENLRVASLAMLAPFVNIATVFDPRENDINSVINTFFTSFTAGYLLVFCLELLVTTSVRLGVFQWFEPDIFKLTPAVPVPILPWVLRENKYRPKRITLFAADFLASCVAAPVIEEYVKLKVLQWTVDLPRNFVWVSKISSKTQKKRRVAEAVVRRPGESDVVNANRYVTHMLASSMGLKLCDAGRRILMYTKPYHANKSFYAICRGIFPIHELCGTMTAIGLAKRNLLGVATPSWKILLPAVVVHGMANFRGMKPVFKWNSATPWSEMQLSPLAVPDSSTLPQLLKKGYAKLMWLIILSRVLGYCVKNYYMVNRQALKRTTTYAGNHAAFSAELATAEMLKKK